jgi:hypothetical protein
MLSPRKIRSIGDSVWRPILGGILVTRNGIKIPLRADGVGNAWNEEQQRAANRCQDKYFHSNLRFGTDARDYCWSKLATRKAQYSADIEAR